MRLFPSMLLIASVALTACNESSTQPSEPTKTKTAKADAVASDFVGCYTIEQGAPALIKIDRNDKGYTMQMKEGADKAEVWDAPESLEAVEIDDAWQYFSSNSLNLNKSDLIGNAIVRTDKIMAMAQVQPATANTNPFIDSSYVVMLINKVATIYQVPCDETRVDRVKNFHHAAPVAPQSK